MEVPIVPELSKAARPTVTVLVVSVIPMVGVSASVILISAVGAVVPMPILLFVASTKKVLEIEATMPDEEAISKKVSGVESPKEKRPDEVEAMVMNLVPALL